MERVFAFRPGWVGDRKVRIRIYRPLQIPLLPEELQTFHGAHPLQGNVEKGNLQLVIERPGGVVVERLCSYGQEIAHELPALVSEAVHVGSPASVNVEIVV